MVGGSVDASLAAAAKHPALCLAHAELLVALLSTTEHPTAPIPPALPAFAHFRLEDKNDLDQESDYAKAYN